MTEKKKTNGVILTGVLSVIAASSCCLPPIITALAGVGGSASSLTWIEPFRPYLIVFTFIAIGYAWYVHLKPNTQDECGCDIEQPKFYQKRSFLVGMTFFAIVSISFPYYAHLFYGNSTNKVVIVNDKSTIKKIDIMINGMTCEACQNHVNKSVLELAGVLKVNTSYNKSNTIIEYDKTKTSTQEIEKAINSTGYSTNRINKIQ